MSSKFAVVILRLECKVRQMGQMIRYFFTIAEHDSDTMLLLFWHFLGG